MYRGLTNLLAQLVSFHYQLVIDFKISRWFGDRRDIAL